MATMGRERKVKVHRQCMGGQEMSMCRQETQMIKVGELKVLKQMYSL